MPFEQIPGAWAFLSLLPLIILYLRKPRPTEQTMPSLMFFMREKGVTKFHSLFRHLFRNLLLLLQLLILAILSLSIMGFFMEISGERSGNTAIVLDVSASMKTAYDGSTRFDAAVAEAENLLGGKVSIVLAADVPRIVLDNKGEEEARSILRSLEPIDTSTNLGDAILVAKDLLGSNGDLYVISDFIATEGIEPLVAKRVVARGVNTKFINVGNNAENVGIIGINVGRTTTVTLKNYNDKTESVTAQLVNGDVIKDEATIEVLPNSLEQFTFDTLEGATKVKLKADDDFPADNTAYVSVPTNIKTDVLLITNADSSNLQAALASSPNINLEIAHPPVISHFNAPVIVMHEVDLQYMLPGYYKSMERVASNGSVLIVTAQENLATADIKFLPVDITGIGETAQNKVNISNFYTNDIEFGVNERYLTSKLSKGTTLVSADGSPVLVVAGQGSGNIVYYGILDEFSSFKNSITYPRFWNNMINALTRKEDLQNFNVRTGRIEVVDSQSVKTPKGTIKTNRVLFDNAGFYTFNNIQRAANLLNERESDVSTNATLFNEESQRIAVEATPLPRKQRFEAILAGVAALLVLLELLYIKIRGDL